MNTAETTNKIEKLPVDLAAQRLPLVDPGVEDIAVHGAGLMR